MAQTREERLAEMEAADRKAARAASIASANDLVAKATKELAAIKDGTATDEARIAVMVKLRAAIDHINEAG